MTNFYNWITTLICPNKPETIGRIAPLLHSFDLKALVVLWMMLWATATRCKIVGHTLNCNLLDARWSCLSIAHTTHNLLQSPRFFCVVRSQSHSTFILFYIFRCMLFVEVWVKASHVLLQGISLIECLIAVPVLLLLLSILEQSTAQVLDCLQ